MAQTVMTAANAAEPTTMDKDRVEYTDFQGNVMMVGLFSGKVFVFKSAVHVIAACTALGIPVPPQITAPVAAPTVPPVAQVAGAVATK